METIGFLDYHTFCQRFAEEANEYRLCFGLPMAIYFDIINQGNDETNGIDSEPPLSTCSRSPSPESDCISSRYQTKLSRIKSVNVRESIIIESIWKSFQSSNQISNGVCHRGLFDSNIGAFKQFQQFFMGNSDDPANAALVSSMLRDSSKFSINSIYISIIILKSKIEDIDAITKILLNCNEYEKYFQALLFQSDATISRIATALIRSPKDPPPDMWSSALDWRIRTSLLALCYRAETSMHVRLQLCLAENYLDFSELIIQISHVFADDLIVFLDNSVFSNFRAVQSSNDLLYLKSHWLFSRLSQGNFKTISDNIAKCAAELSAHIDNFLIKQTTSHDSFSSLLDKALASCRLVCICKATEEINRVSSKDSKSNSFTLLKSLISMTDALCSIFCSNSMNIDSRYTNDTSSTVLNSMNEEILIRIILLSRCLFSSLLMFHLFGHSGTSSSVGDNGGSSDNLVISYITKACSILFSISSRRNSLCIDGKCLKASHELDCLSSFLFFVKICSVSKDDYQIRLLCSKELGLAQIKDFHPNSRQSLSMFWNSFLELFPSSAEFRSQRRIISQFKNLPYPHSFSLSLERPGDWAFCLHLLFTIDVFKLFQVTESDYFVSILIERSIFPIHSAVVDIIDLSHKRNLSKSYQINNPTSSTSSRSVSRDQGPIILNEDDIDRTSNSGKTFSNSNNDGEENESSEIGGNSINSSNESLSYYPKTVALRCASLHSFPLIDLKSTADISRMNNSSSSYRPDREIRREFGRLRTNNGVNSESLHANELTCSLCSRPIVAGLAFSFPNFVAVDESEEISSFFKQSSSSSGGSCSTNSPCLAQSVSKAIKLVQAFPLKSLNGATKYCNCKNSQTLANKALGCKILEDNYGERQSLLPGILSIYSSLRYLFSSQIVQCSKYTTCFSCDLASLPIKNCISLILMDTMRTFGNSCGLLYKIIPIIILFCEDILISDSCNSGIIKGLRPDPASIVSPQPYFSECYSRTISHYEMMYKFYRESIVYLLTPLSSCHKGPLVGNSNNSRLALSLVLTGSLDALKYFKISKFSLLPTELLNSIVLNELLPSLLRSSDSTRIAQEDNNVRSHKKRKIEMIILDDTERTPFFEARSYLDSQSFTLKTRNILELFCEILDSHPLPHDLVLRTVNFFLASSSDAFTASHINSLNSFQQLVEEPLVLLRLPKIHLYNHGILFILIYILKKVLFKQSENLMNIKIHSLKKLGEITRSSLSSSKVPLLSSLYQHIDSKLMSTLQWTIFVKMLIVCGISYMNHIKHQVCDTSPKDSGATQSNESDILPIIYDTIGFLSAEINNFFELILKLDVDNNDIKFLCVIPEFSHQILQILTKKLSTSNTAMFSTTGREAAHSTDDVGMPYSQTPIGNFMEYAKLLKTAIEFTKLYYKHTFLHGNSLNGSGSDESMFPNFLSSLVDFVLQGQIKYISCFHPWDYVNSVGDLVFDLFDCLLVHKSSFAILLFTNIMEENPTLVLRQPLNYGIKKLREHFKGQLGSNMDNNIMDIAVSRIAMKALN